MSTNESTHDGGTRQGTGRAWRLAGGLAAWQRRAWAAALSLSGLVVLLGIWQWRIDRHPTFFLPTPSAIVGRLHQDWLSGQVSQLFLTGPARHAIAQTFTTALIGWAVACLVGVCVGTILGVRPGLAAIASPPLLILRSVPPVSIIPIAIVILGLGSSMRLAVVVTGCIWPVLLNAVEAVAGVDPVLRDVATLSRLGRFATFARVLLPAASPKLFAGMRVSLSLAIVLAVGAELLAGTGGLGGALLTAQSSFNVPGMWAALAALALLGAVVNGVLLLAERMALRWNTYEGNTGQ